MHLSLYVTLIWLNKVAQKENVTPRCQHLGSCHIVCSIFDQENTNFSQHVWCQKNRYS